MKLTSTLSQYLDGAPIEKKTVAKLVRRASLNAVPFDFKKDVTRFEAGRHDHKINPKRINQEDASNSSLNRDDDSHTSSHQGTQFNVSIPVPSNDRNPCEFIYLGDTLEDHCDYLFYRVYTLSHSDYLHNSQNKEYLDRKREVLNEWIGKRTFLSMCLALNLIDDRSITSFIDLLV